MPTTAEIRKLREAAGLTQQQLATFLGVGIATVARWEGGGAPPGADSMTGRLLGCMEKIHNANPAGLRWMADHLRDEGPLTTLRRLLTDYDSATVWKPKG